VHSLELTHDVATDTKDALDQLASLPGVSFVALMDRDREGFLMDCAGRLAGDAEALSAMASCLLETSEGIGRELRHGALRCTISEFDDGLVLAMGAAASSRLIVVLHDVAALDAVRRSARDVVAALPCTL
jgi:predicted regulator of Ras-like GTPase activity (Roadblock/LC7/MglB family)